MENSIASRGIAMSSSFLPSTSKFQKVHGRRRDSRPTDWNMIVSVLDVRILPDRIAEHEKDSLLDLGKLSTESCQILNETGELTDRISIFDNGISREDMLDKIIHEAQARNFLLGCKQKKAVKEAFDFFGCLPSPSLSLYRVLLGVCVAAANFEGAKKAFQSAKTAGFTRDCGIYTAFITVCCKTKQLDAAFMAFHEMESSGIEPDVMTYGALIDGCVKVKQVAKAFGVYGILLSKKVKPDRVIFHSLIMACGKGENLQRAFDVLQDMKAAEIPPDNVTMSILLNVCTECKAVDRAMGVYRVMRQKGAATSPAAYTSAIDACAVTGSLDAARGIYKDMLKDKVAPDEIVFCALIKVAASAEVPNYAFFLRQEMKVQKIQITSKTYNAWLHLCAMLNLPDRALTVYAEMKAARISPDIVTFNTLLQALCSVKRLDEALAIVDEMAAAGVQANHLTYKILLKGCADPNVPNAELAFKLYHTADLEGKSANLENCNSLIEICYTQIGKKALPPCFSVTAGRFSFDANMRTPQQQWASCALSLYRQILAAGVKPTRTLVSKLLGCLRKPRFGQSEEATSAEDPPLFMKTLGTAGSLPFGLTEGTSKGWLGAWEEFFEEQAFSVYEEAAGMGVFPSVSGPQYPESLDLRGVPSNAARVSILLFLRNLKESARSRTWTGKQPRPAPLDLTLHPLEGFVVKKDANVRALRMSARSTQAVIGLLNRIRLPFEGSSASGKLHISAQALEKWLQQQPEPSTNGRLPAQREIRLGQNLARQQSAIRMGSSPVYSPSSYYAKPSPVADWSWEGISS